MFWSSKRGRTEPAKIANAYYVLDREMERMHALINGTHAKNESNAQEFWKRIKLMQDAVIECAKESDEKLHEKIAEYALTGVTQNDTQDGGD